MPTINVPRERLFSEIGCSMSDEKFDDLCFQLGIELDEITSERQLIAKEQGTEKANKPGLSDAVLYRIEVPANRYDMLSIEGITRAIRIFITGEPCPVYTVVPGKISVKIQEIRPFIACAVLRGIEMTPEIYDSLIDLQDKLHSGLGRKRTIVSIGTYDLDTLVPQEGDSTITYDAIKPSDFHLVPLNRTQSVDGLGLMTMLESDLKLKKFLPLIRDLPKYPVLRDARGTVMSVPPIINGDSSKITLNTRNIFIDVTGIDEQKVLTALDILVCAFSRYGKPSSYNVSGEQCGSVQEDGSPHEYVESVTILNAENNEIRKTPALSTRSQLVSISYVNDIVGVSFTGMQMIDLIKKMMLGGRLVMKKGLEESSFSSEDYIEALIPPNRPDIIHECDVMEDVAIAYGFNRIPATVPTCPTNAEPLPINKFTDQLRREVALAGFTEVLTFSLCSHAENFSMIRRQDPGNEAIVLSNPKTAEFEVVHTSLLPSMLKTLSSNRKMPLPQRIFQVADVVLKVNAGDNFDYSTNVQYALEVGARNERRLCIVQCGTVSGFEVIHGILDRLMQVLNVRPTEYSISPSEIPTFFPGRQAAVAYKGIVIGAFGIVHPEVMSNFEVPNVASLLEINIEPFI